MLKSNAFYRLLTFKYLSKVAAKIDVHNNGFKKVVRTRV